MNDAFAAAHYRYEADRVLFLSKLNWTDPYVDLYDTVLDFLYDEVEAKRNDPAYAAMWEEHFRTGINDHIFPTTDRLAEIADRIVRARLK